MILDADLIIPLTRSMPSCPYDLKFFFDMVRELKLTTVR
jgi:hypothetical protein